MKVYLKDLERERQLSPCTYCGVGWGSTSNGEDKTGKYMEVKSCKDDGACIKYDAFKLRKQQEVIKCK